MTVDKRNIINITDAFFSDPNGSPLKENDGKVVRVDPKGMPGFKFDDPNTGFDHGVGHPIPF